MSALSLIDQQADAETARLLRVAHSRLRLARASGLLDGLHRVWIPDPMRTERERRSYEQAFARGREIWEGRA